MNLVGDTRNICRCDKEKEVVQERRKIPSHLFAPLLSDVGSAGVHSAFGVGLSRLKPSSPASVLFLTLCMIGACASSRPDSMMSFCKGILLVGGSHSSGSRTIVVFFLFQNENVGLFDTIGNSTQATGKKRNTTLETLLSKR